MAAPHLYSCYRFRFEAVLVLLTVFAVQSGARAQEPDLLQDTTPSPSDSNSVVEERITDQVQQSPVQQAAPIIQRDASQTTVPQPANPQTAAPQTNSIQGNAGQQPTPATGPNVASLGGNRLNMLSPSTTYVNPVALALGVGQGRASSDVDSYFGSATHRKLLDTPEMFGDFRRPGSSIVFDPAFTVPYDYEGGLDFPSAVAFSGTRVSENNVALPQDRIWASYHHLHNAFMTPGGDTNLDRFILGFEKTFHGGSSSVEFRLPIAGSLDPVDSFGTTAYAGGSFGNLGVIYKRVLVANSNRVIAAGLRVETPTGSTWYASDDSNGPAAISLDPTAVYLTPYLGTLRQIDDIWFINSFLQLDIATGGDRMLATLNGSPAQEFLINQPTLLQIDLGAGVWLVTPSACNAGVAAISELHIANALSDDDTFQAVGGGVLPNVFVDYTPIRNLVNWTGGLHTQLSNLCSIRTAISVPLLNDRIFDTEVMVQINRNY